LLGCLILYSQQAASNIASRLWLCGPLWINSEIVFLGMLFIFGPSYRQRMHWVVQALVLVP